MQKKKNFTMYTQGQRKN